MRLSLRTTGQAIALSFTAFVLIVVGLRIQLQVKTFFHNFDEHQGVVISQADALRKYSTKPGWAENEAVVPKIIHHIFHNWTDPSNEVLPEGYAARRQTCVDMNPEWEHWLWSTEESREFISEEYPWFLATYDNFHFPIQRIDTLRYFLIRHYGGIYIDLDNPCLAPLDPLRYYPVWVVDGGCGSLSNDVIAGEPAHPFWIFLTESIQHYAWNYPLPFLTISYATGQWFETEIWEKYHATLSPADVALRPPLTRILTDSRPGAPAPVFFFRDAVQGGAWDNWDNRLFDWIAYHNTQFIVICVLLGAAALAGLVWFVRRCRRGRKFAPKV